MCGFAGFYSRKENYLMEQEKWKKVLNSMCACLEHRGPDEQHTLLTKSYGAAHTRLAIIDLEHGSQPMCVFLNGIRVSIVYNGELYNGDVLRRELEKCGEIFDSDCDTEVILRGYLVWGVDVADKLNGIFAFAIMDERDGKLFLARDMAGVKPLYYTKRGDALVFASEIKGLFVYPGMVPEVDESGWNEVLGLGPAKTSGNGVFKNVKEVRPGYLLINDDRGLRDYCYCQLKAEEHKENYEKTVEHTRELVTDAIKRQMVSDVPIATFLSGGIDSSIVSAVCARELEKEGKTLGSFSFDFMGNEIYFQANSFQRTQDRPFVEIMVDKLKTKHRFLVCDNNALYEQLFFSVDSRDLPTMADVDSSMLYFCKQVSHYNKVVLTGECADEIFGGYPWFYREEDFQTDTFPWSKDLSPRKCMLKDEVLRRLHMDEYVHEAYKQTIRETPKLEGETKVQTRRREIQYLNIRWFMQTLLDRMDRTSMAHGLEARVPFADKRIIQYLYNVPWEMKCQNQVEKSLLRDAMGDLLPEEILHRKKSPYPKTYHPEYEERLKFELRKVLEGKKEPLLELVDKEKVLRYMGEKKDYGRPWYGQLMAGPQMLAYLLQINYWMKKYDVHFG